jgi:hypothetical protein
MIDGNSFAITPEAMTYANMPPILPTLYISNSDTTAR